MKLKRIAVIVLLFFLFSCLLCACYDKREVDDMTYAIAIGFDKGKLNPLKMTIQYAIPLAIGSGGGGEGGKGGPGSVSTVTIEVPTIYSGLNMLNNFIGKQLNMSHAEVAVFSEEIAKSGKMHDYIHAMVRGREFRPNMNIAVSRGSAEEYIKSVQPIQEANPAKYYELKFSTYKYNGYTANTQLSNFYNGEEADGIQAVATLVGVSRYDASKDIDPTISTAYKKGRVRPLMGDYLAGDIPKSGDIKGETLGLAVFNGKKMAGELDGQEATMYLMASGKFGHAFLTFPDPEVKESYVVLNVKQSREPRYKIKLTDGKPDISLQVKLEADFLSIQSGINYEESKLVEFENSTERFLKGEIQRLLVRTSKELNSDPVGFGRYAKKSFLTWNEWINYNWFEKYANASFNVDVDMKIRRTGLMIRSIPDMALVGKDE